MRSANAKPPKRRAIAFNFAVESEDIELVASEKQIAANRANAQRSSGPKTAAGEQRAGRNALRHGLSVGKMLPLVSTADLNEMLGLLCGQDALFEARQAAVTFVLAQTELRKISDLRSAISGPINSLKDRELWRMAALDRYEKRALTRRRRVCKILESENLQNEPNFVE